MADGATTTNPTAPPAGAAQTNFALGVVSQVLGPTTQNTAGIVHKYTGLKHTAAFSKKVGDSKKAGAFGVLADLFKTGDGSLLVTGKGNVWIESIKVELTPKSDDGELGICLTTNTTNFKTLEDMFQSTTSTRQIFDFVPATRGKAISFDLPLPMGGSQQLFPPSGFYPMVYLSILQDGSSIAYRGKVILTYSCTNLITSQSLN